MRSATSATRVMNPKAPTKSSNWKRRRRRPSPCSQPSSRSSASWISASESRAGAMASRQGVGERVLERVAEGSGGLGPDRLAPEAADRHRRLALAEGGVALGLEALGQLGAARGLDAAPHHDVHVVGAEDGEQTVVVRDGQDAEPAFLGGPPDPAGHGAQGVDVEARVELGEDGDPGLEDGQLERLVALLLAAGEVDVEGPVE